MLLRSNNRHKEGPKETARTNLSFKTSYIGKKLIKKKKKEYSNTMKVPTFNHRDVEEVDHLSIHDVGPIPYTTAKYSSLTTDNCIFISLSLSLLFHFF